jgi:DNA-binding transcriptional ArsR family regulator
LTKSNIRSTLKPMLDHPPLDRVFHALAEPNRLAIVERLNRGPASVSQLAEPLPVTLAAVVQHVQVLEDTGIVVTEKVGRVRSCRLAPAGLAAAERWLHAHREQWEQRLDRLGRVLTEDDAREEDRP